MGIRTGKPRGRPKGSKSKRTKEREQRVSEAAHMLNDALGENAFHGDAHALLMAVYKDQSIPLKARLDAAVAAIGYEKPRLAAIEHSGEVTQRHVNELSEADLERIATDGSPGAAGATSGTH